MLSYHAHLKVFVATAPCDLRASFNGLWNAAQTQLGEDPKSGALFVFGNWRKNRIKILYFDGTGFVVLAKRLEEGCFNFPRSVRSQAKSPANPRTGSGPESLCGPHQAAIVAALGTGLSVQRIYQDLVAAHGFAGSYASVWRLVRKLTPEEELLFRRMECAPGAELHHGTTRKQVGKLFETAERPALRPLPARLFPVFEEARRTVHRDGHVEFKKAYYSVPPEYVGRIVRVRQETRLLRIHNTRREQIALHALAEPGQFTTDPLHLHSRKRHVIERGVDHLLEHCRSIGPLTDTWAEGMHAARGPQSLRVLLGLLQLAERHPAAGLEKAAGLATHHGTWRLRDLKRLLELRARSRPRLVLTRSQTS